MTTSDAIKEIKANPELEFTTVIEYNTFTLWKVDGEVDGTTTPGIGMYTADGVCNWVAIVDNWEPVRQSVTCQEALEMWANNEKIICKIGNTTYNFEDRNIFINPKMITDGKWYIL